MLPGVSNRRLQIDRFNGFELPKAAAGLPATCPRNSEKADVSAEASAAQAPSSTLAVTARPFHGNGGISSANRQARPTGRSLDGTAVQASGGSELGRSGFRQRRRGSPALPQFRPRSTRKRRRLRGLCRLRNRRPARRAELPRFVFLIKFGLVQRVEYPAHRD